ncbi:MAG: hypothetical protein EOO60_08830, partial [Hymenobacter sp.]
STGQNKTVTFRKKQLGAPTKSAEVVEQVRRLKASGASNQAIARSLKISPSTVAKYLVI